MKIRHFSKRYLSSTGKSQFFTQSEIANIIFPHKDKYLFKIKSFEIIHCLSNYLIENIVQNIWLKFHHHITIEVRIILYTNQSNIVLTISMNSFMLKKWFKWSLKYFNDIRFTNLRYGTSIKFYHPSILMSQLPSNRLFLY